MKTKILIFLIGTVLLAGCKKEKNGQESNPQIPVETVVIKEKIVEQSLDSISNSTGTLYFSNLPDNVALEEGNVIVSGVSDAAPQGFLYKVERITQDGDKTIVETTDATLEEAIGNGSVSATINLDDQPFTVIDEDGNQVMPVRVKGLETKFTFPVYKEWKDPADNRYSITVSGEFSLSNELQLEASVEWGKLKYLRIADKIETELKINVKGEISGKHKFGENLPPIRTINLSPVTIMFGIIPVVVTPAIPVYLTAEVSGKAGVELNIFNRKISNTLGVKYENGNTSGILEHAVKNESALDNPLKFNFDGECKLKLSPKMQLTLYNVDAAKIGLEASLYGSLKVSAKLDEPDKSIEDSQLKGLIYDLDPTLKVAIGAEANVFANMEIFKRNLVDYKSLKVTLFELDLFNASLFPKFEDIAVHSNNGITTTLETRLKTPSSFTYVFPVSDYGFVWSSKSVNPKTETDSYVSMGALPSLWNVGTVPSLQAQLHLPPNTTFNVCPYFTNFLGTFYGKVKSFKTEGANVIEIGNQIWMAKNLDVTAFRNGDMIAEAKNKDEWQQFCEQGTPAYCNYMYKSDNKNTYGLFYNGYVILDSREIAPEGWQIPTIDDFRYTYGKISPDDFMPVYGGYLYYEGYWAKIEQSLWWTSTRRNDLVLDTYGIAKEKEQEYYSWITTGSGAWIKHGLNIRCIKKITAAAEAGKPKM
ncbi:MAG: fibrobacter succinogenes major paralogous domain-containing protein [Prevotellaceae bacterium]|jgi:hypothetical protein|nr:fibrobacter succinogenes major paralogous domain-containing protein [Prevotellaceae bacterium]